jgi:arylsulfatase A-like enzyme
MLVAGPGIRQGVVFDRAMQSTDLVPTLGSMLGFSPSLAQGTPISELL